MLHVLDIQAPHFAQAQKRRSAPCAASGVATRAGRRAARSTTTLALGSRQLSAQGAIVTRLTAIEEMAGMTVLCSDKTGTLTLNQMVIQARQTLKPGPNPKAPRSGALSAWATAPRLALR